MSFFAEFQPVGYAGPQSRSPYAYRYYQPDKLVMGKRMADHLRISVCCWHSFGWNGHDQFGFPTMKRPWLEASESSAYPLIDAAFEFATLLGVPFLSFHDEDLLPFRHASAREYFDDFSRVTAYVQDKMQDSGVGVLLATANLFSLPCFCAGAASSPDPDVFAFAAAKVRNMLDAARLMHAENYVLWGGRDGYSSLLNTSLPRELDQLGRFVSMVVDYRHKIGFKGALLIEPKPCEPCKHQYDHDVATVHGFLVRYGLEGEVKVNIEANHATLAGHSFAHEVAYACALDVLGSIDANRGDPQNGWDTDQFPSDIAELTHVLTLLLDAGGFDHGGFNFDARLRRDSTDPGDLLLAHVAGIDALARSLEIAEQLIQDRVFSSLIEQRYCAWNQAGHPVASHALNDLDAIADYVCAGHALPAIPRGQQEWIEHRLATYLW